MQTNHSRAIRILLIDNSLIVRAGLRLLIERWTHMKVVGEASGPAEAFAIAAQEKPDIILLELDLQQNGPGLELLSGLCSARSGGQIIILTRVHDTELHYRAMQLGAMGLVLKDQPPEDLRKAILKVHSGEAWLDPKLMTNIITSMSRPRGKQKIDLEKTKFDLLTRREKEVTALIGEGLKNKSIAKRLFVSETTVRHHLTSIFSKLEVSDRFELLIYLYRHHLVKPEAIESMEKAVNS